MDKRANLLIFMSDQHSKDKMGFWGSDPVETPHMDRLAKNGTTFSHAYTSCPLCVPARISMLSGLLPSKTGCFNNEGSLHSDIPTFLTALAAQGYETVLCGRMHFLGPDQRHGFTKRLGADICPTSWGFQGHLREDLGILKGTMNEQGCTKVVGSGPSNVLDYDRYIVDLALEYLDQNFEKPQCIVVGTYGPHFPYVAPKHLYKKYKNLVQLPPSLVQGYNYALPMISHRQKPFDKKLYLDIQAAYSAMISHTDSLLGELKAKWDKKQKNEENQGYFIYLSDHGDQAGDRNLFAKQTFFNSASQIPLIIEGAGVLQGRIIDSPVSIMDIGVSICDLLHVDYDVDIDGVSFAPLLFSSDSKRNDNFVISELLEIDKENKDISSCSIVPARMICQGDWKLIVYYGFEENSLLFNLKSDPYELNNLIKVYPEKGEKLYSLLKKEWNPLEVIEKFRKNMKNYRLLAKWGKNTHQKQSEMWFAPRGSRYLAIEP